VHERAGGEHRVQRQQQVDGAPVGGDRQPEGKRQHGQQREGPRVAAHHQRERGDDDERSGGAGGEHGRARQTGRQRQRERRRGGGHQRRTSSKLCGEGIERFRRSSATRSLYSPAAASGPWIRGTSVV
jgi:hypothetical protein